MRRARDRSFFHIKGNFKEERGSSFGIFYFLEEGFTIVV